MQQELRQLLSIDHERRVNKRQVVVWLDGHAPVVEPATIFAMPMAAKPVSKAGLLIHFMLFQIPLLKFQTFNLVAKVRLIATKNRIPNLSLGLG